MRLLSFRCVFLRPLWRLAVEKTTLKLSDQRLQSEKNETGKDAHSTSALSVAHTSKGRCRICFRIFCNIIHYFYSPIYMYIPFLWLRRIIHVSINCNFVIFNTLIERWSVRRWVQTGCSLSLRIFAPSSS